MERKKTRVSMTLDEDILEMLKAYAEADERSVSACTNRLLREILHMKKAAAAKAGAPDGSIRKMTS